MADLPNAFAQTTITSGYNTKRLNVLQVQRILESNINDCSVISVIPKEICTLIRMSFKGQTVDLAIAANSVAVRAANEKQKTDYTGDLVETVLNIVNSLSTDAIATRNFDAQIEEMENEALEKAIMEEIKRVVREGNNASLKEITSNGFYRRLAKEVIQERMKHPHGELRDIINIVLERTVASVR